MSYCRPGADSDVYVYATISDGWVCGGCEMDRGHEGFGDRAGIIAHLEKHIAAGDRVPAYALDRLANE